MKPKSIAEQSMEWVQALAQVGNEIYSLRLYVTGTTPKSISAITNVKRICETHLKGRYKLEVVDIYQQPALAEGNQIVAAPTLIKSLPLPLRKFIGDMTKGDRILIGLDLPRSNRLAEANGKAKRPKKGK